MIVPAWAHRFIDAVGAKIKIEEGTVRPLCSFVWGYGTRERPNLRNIEFDWRDRKHGLSLYMNGLLFVRICAGYIGVMLRWSATARPSFIQYGIGYKPNGEPAMGGWWVVLWPLLTWAFGWHWWYLVFFGMIRLQTDDSAKIGFNPGENSGHAEGFEYGPH